MQRACNSCLNIWRAGATAVAAFGDADHEVSASAAVRVPNIMRTSVQSAHDLPFLTGADVPRYPASSRSCHAAPRAFPARTESHQRIALRSVHEPGRRPTRHTRRTAAAHHGSAGVQALAL